MIIDRDFAREIAATLLDINAILLRPNDPFSWPSGWNSPIYSDYKLTLRYPEVRKKIAGKISSYIKQNFTDLDVITGTSTAGIPHAAWVAHYLDMPMAYVRVNSLTQGMASQIEGGVDKGQKTVIIDDLISTGDSAISVIEALQFIGADVKATISILNYEFDETQKRFKKLSVPIYSLTDYKTLLDVAIEKGLASEDDLPSLLKWQKSPSTWPK